MRMGLDLILLEIVGTIAFAPGWGPYFFNYPRPPPAGQTPLEILKGGYAGGEITREEYEQMRRDLEG